MSRTTTLSAAAVLLAAGLVGTSPSPATAAPTTCATATFTTRIRHVQDSAPTIRFSRLEAKTYPGRTTIAKDQKVHVERDRTLRVSLHNTAEATLGASALLKKVVNVYARLTGKTELKTSFASTVHESTTVASSTKLVIPGGTSVVWFRGWLWAHKSFQYSWCHHFGGMPEGYGTLTWTNATFTTYGYKSSGGQRCDLAAQERVARAAKNAVCV